MAENLEKWSGSYGENNWTLYCGDAVNVLKKLTSEVEVLRAATIGENIICI
jgi:hypothetical protein